MVTKDLEDIHYIIAQHQGMQHSMALLLFSKSSLNHLCQHLITLPIMVVKASNTSPSTPLA